jgi:hypothetical protein
MNVFVPELVYSREERHCSVPYVTGVIDKSVPHLHLSVFEPMTDISVIFLQSTFPDGSSSTEVLLGFFPLGILDPGAGVPGSNTSHTVFEFSSFGKTVFCEFLWVGDFNCCGFESVSLEGFGFFEELLCCDLSMFEKERDVGEKGKREKREKSEGDGMKDGIEILFQKCTFKTSHCLLLRLIHTCVGAACLFLTGGARGSRVPGFPSMFSTF